MATTTAKNRKDVDNMTAEERAWDSLNYSYGKKRESSDKSYNKAISQQDRTMQRRGMGRSSYGMQTLAGLQNEKNKAANDIYSEQIADYENRRYQIDRDKVADDQWERTFGENQRQFNENLKENQRQFDTKNVQWWNEFNENKRQYDLTRGDNLSMWWNEFNENKRQYDLTRGDNLSMWWNDYNLKKQQIDNQMYQWEKELGYTEKSDTQKRAYDEAMYAIQLGADVDDATLEKAGISRNDFNNMRARILEMQVGTSGGSGGGGGGEIPGTTNNTGGLSLDELAAAKATVGAINATGNVANSIKNANTSKVYSTTLNSGQYSAYQAQQNANKKTTSSTPNTTTMNSGQYYAYQAEQNAKKKK